MYGALLHGRGSLRRLRLPEGQGPGRRTGRARRGRTAALHLQWRPALPAPAPVDGRRVDAAADLLAEHAPARPADDLGRGLHARPTGRGRVRQLRAWRDQRQFGVPDPRRGVDRTRAPSCRSAAVEALSSRLPSFLRPAIVPFDLADSDHVMAVPDFSSFSFHDHMFGVSGKGQDRFMVLPIDDGDSGPVGISRRLNAQIALVALSKLHHPLIGFPMLGMVHVSVDRCENDCVVRRLGSLRDERHDSTLFVSTCACVHVTSHQSSTLFPDQVSGRATCVYGCCSQRWVWRVAPTPSRRAMTPRAEPWALSEAPTDMTTAAWP